MHINETPFADCGRLPYLLDQVNHPGTHHDRRNRDYAKRRFAEDLGWHRVPIWINSEPMPEIISQAIETIQRIIEERLCDETTYYDRFITEDETQDRTFYDPEQPYTTQNARRNSAHFESMRTWP